MQIHLGNSTIDKRRVDFYCNTSDGIFIELVNENGMTYFSKQISETERLRLIETLIKNNNKTV